jgi:hypothetical protein
MKTFGGKRSELKRNEMKRTEMKLNEMENEMELKWQAIAVFAGGNDRRAYDK